MNVRRSLALAAGLLSVMNCIGCQVAGLAGERITSFRCDVQVHEDGTASAVETFSVRSTGDRVQHGIWREFPADHVDSSGDRRPFEVKVEQVRQNGEPAEHFLFAIPGGSRVYIGDRDALLPPGDHEYSIRYSTSPIVEEVEGRACISWEITGSGLSLPIDKLTATFELPVRRSDAAEAEVSMQPGGDAERVTADTRRGRVEVVTQGKLEEGQRLQVRISWPAAE